MKEKSIRHGLRDSLALIKQHKYSFLGTAILLQFLIALGAQVFTLLFRLALFAADQSSLDKQSIGEILTSPTSLALLVFLVFVFGFLFLFEMSVLVQVIDAARREERLSFKRILRTSFKKLRHIRGLHFCSFLIYLLLTLPIAGIVVSSSLTESLYIPDFITGEFTKTTAGVIGVTVAGLLLFYFNIRLIYTLPVLVTQDLSFTAAIKESWQRTRKGLFKLLGTISLFEMILGSLSLVFIFVSVLLLALLDPQGSNLLAATVFLTLIRLITYFFTILTKIGVMSFLVADLGQRQADQPAAKHGKKRNWLILSLALLLLIGQTLISALDLYSLALNENQKVIAHRGAVADGVENSIEALEAAARQKADMVEMDILLTKDHQFVVMHDYNLKRLAGIDKRVQDMTLDEVQGLKITQDGHTSQIPSFDEYVARAKALNIKLLVELKPHGDEPDNYADLFIAKMRQMEEIEKKAPEIETGFVIPIHFGSFADSDFDFYAIEDFSYNIDLLEQAHQQKKKLYVWTVNDEQKMTDYLQRPLMPSSRTSRTRPRPSRQS